MQIEERSAGDVVILDLKGKITLGEGDELLKDKVNSLVNQGQKKIVLNLHDGQPAGRQPQAVEPDQADHGSLVDYQAADGFRDLRERERRGQELHGIGQGLILTR